MQRILHRNLGCLNKSLPRKILTDGHNAFTAQSFRNKRKFHNSQLTFAIKPYLLADIGEGITECQVISWSVKPGDKIQQFEPLCEVQSDKASVEITSRYDGTITKLYYDVDDMAAVGKPLVDIDIEGDVSEEPNTPESSTEHQKNEQKIQIEEKTQDAVARQTIQSPSAASDTPQPNPSLLKPSGKHAGLATPAIRHMIKEHELSLTDINGTGKDGRVLKEDVQRYISTRSTASSSPVTSPPERSGQDETINLTPVQTQMFQVMTQSLTIPHFLFSHVVDVTSLNAMRKRFRANADLLSFLQTSGDPSIKLTALPFILKVLSQAFTKFPFLNAHLDTETNPNRPQLITKASHNFGIAIDSPSGLLVPVVRDVQNHSIFSLAAEIERLSKLAREGKLSPQDFKGATFIISNMGSIGGSVVSPVIVKPMVGILGVGRAQEVAVFQKDQSGEEKIVKREQVVLSWSADHRILDGATIAKCARVVGELLENTESLMLALK